MIITVQGYLSDNHAVDVISAVSCIGAIGKKRRSLILQLMNNTNKNVETLIMGKILRAREIKFSGISITSMETGIDALLRLQQTGNIEKEDFTATCIAVANADNVFDILGVSQKTSFEEENLTDMEELTSLVNTAKNVYADVYILLPTNNMDFNKYFMDLADKNIFCFKQGFKNTVKIDAKHVYPVITDYESESIFNTKYYKKLWNMKDVFTMPHNAGYKDAAVTDSILSFINKNLTDEKGDSNYYFISQLYELSNFIIGNEVSTVENTELPKLDTKKETKKTKELKKGTSYKKTEKKNGLFRKSSLQYIPIEESEEEKDEEAAPIFIVPENTTEEKETAAAVAQKKEEKKGFFRKKPKVKNENTIILGTAGAGIGFSADNPLSEATEENTSQAPAPIIIDEDINPYDLLQEYSKEKNLSLSETIALLNLPFSASPTDIARAINEEKRAEEERKRQELLRAEEEKRLQASLNEPAEKTILEAMELLNTYASEKNMSVSGIITYIGLTPQDSPEAIFEAVKKAREKDLRSFQPQTIEEMLAMSKQ